MVALEPSRRQWELPVDQAILVELHERARVEGSMDPALPGRLYEERLAQRPKLRKGSGCYYTPEFLVDFVVKETLTPLVTGRSLEELFHLRICDPSCGAGAFLWGAMRFIEAQAIALGAESTDVLRQRICRDCLVGVDVDASALAVCSATLALASGESVTKPMATLLHKDALLPETELGRLDAIVGNPPWGQKSIRLSQEERKRYRELFCCAVGPLDPFKLFVERCHQLLPNGGRWGLVLPDILLLKNVQEVRDLILEGTALDHIAHCGRVFSGVNLDAVAVVGTRVVTPPSRQHTVRIWPELTQANQSDPNASRCQSQAIFTEFPGHKFNLYLHGEGLALYRRLQSYERLGDHFEMHEGVHTGNVRSRLFVSEKRHGECRPVIVGKGELRRYQLRWGGMWIDLDPKCVDRAKGDYANLGRRSWHEAQKIVVRRTGDRIVAAVDTHGHFVSNNLFLLLCDRATDQLLHATVALLNSCFMTWYFRATQPRRGRLFAELKLVHLRDFPVPSRKRWRKAEPVLFELAKRGAELGELEVRQAVDEVVFRLYGFSAKERATILAA